MGRKAVFASDANLSHFGCVKKSAPLSTPSAPSIPSTPSTTDGIDVPDSLTYKNWQFCSFHKKILDCRELCQVASDISDIVGGTLSSDDHISVSDHTLRLPAMIFGNDLLSLEYCIPPIDKKIIPQNGPLPPSAPIASLASTDEASATAPIPPTPSSTPIPPITPITELNQYITISIDAKDALCCWAAQHMKSNEDVTPLNIIQVPYAKSWNQRSKIPVDNNEKKEKNAEKNSDEKKIEKYENEKSAQVITATDDVITSGSPSSRISDRNIWDWTFTSDYCCTLGSHQSYTDGNNNNSENNEIMEKVIVSGRVLSDGKLPLLHIFQMKEEIKEELGGTQTETKGLKPIWKISEGSGIDYNLLRQQDIPILFFDEILLYQDDLEDCGDVLFDAKLRVMPGCWFILSRFFVRVDGAIVRIRDTRLFHRFGSTSVSMEVTWKEQDLTVDYGKEAVDQVLSNAVLMNPALCAEKIPIVNERENIHKYYTLDLY